MSVCVCQAPFRSNPLYTEIIFHTYASGESLGFSEIAFASVKGERPGPFSHFPHRYKSSHTSPQLCPETELVYMVGLDFKEACCQKGSQGEVIMNLICLFLLLWWWSVESRLGKAWRQSPKSTSHPLARGYPLP